METFKTWDVLYTTTTEIIKLFVYAFLIRNIKLRKYLAEHQTEKNDTFWLFWRKKNITDHDYFEKKASQMISFYYSRWITWRAYTRAAGATSERLRTVN